MSWCDFNGLVMNPSKSQSIVISCSNVDRSSVAKINVGGTAIEYGSFVRNLGLILNARFAWDSHVSLICSRVFGGLRTLRACFSITPNSVRRRLVILLLMPFFHTRILYF